VAIYFAIRFWKLATASKSWPSVPGKVVSCEISTGESSSDSSQSITTYTPKVAYEFVINGETVRSKRIKFGGVPRTTNLAKARAIASQYPVGGSVTVFYDPRSQCSVRWIKPFHLQAWC